MASLHAALKALAPITFSDVPTNESDLDRWISDVFTQSQLVLDSIPIVEPSSSSAAPNTSHSVVAANASEVTPSAARPSPPTPDHQALQKEWGKPIKLGAKENSLGMSVYKLSGKDGRGAWFARRSVHEGIAFSHFKKSLEMEFPESLAVQGAPGEGNVRGIGGETKVEDIKVPGKGRIEIYRLSAQFPGPTTPRDFVTLLVTSESAIAAAKDGEPVPKHYMIVSKPCDHPETQPQTGFVRGFYESVEFIREVPKQTKVSQSTTNLPEQTILDEKSGKDAVVREAQQNTDSSPSANASDLSGTSSTATLRPPQLKEPTEVSPVEWIMVTRSDPGGSVPRFMVERGTPGSICADAEKFLNWACQQEFNDEQGAEVKDSGTPAGRPKTESFQSFRSSRMAGLEGESGPTPQAAIAPIPHVEKEVPFDSSGTNQQQQGGLLGAVSGAATYLSSYTPQVVLDQLSGSNAASPKQSEEHPGPPVRDDDDAISVASFESADSHLTTSESEAASATSPKTTIPRKSEEHLTHHEKELRKLEERRAALINKFSESRSKLEQDTTAQNTKDEVAKQKVIEKHEKELKKQQEKHDKELQKIEQKQEKERKKIEDNERKKADKDEKTKLKRERDEARKELELSKKEAGVLRSVVEDLQKENTALVAKLGKVSLANEVSGDDASILSRHSSQKKARGHAASDSTSTSIKSQ